MIKFGELKDFTKGIVIPKLNIDDDKYINISDILNGKYFSCFKMNSNPSLIIDGLYVENNIIGVKWKELDDVKIIPSEEYIKPMGGSVELQAKAKYRLYSLQMGKSKKLENEYEKPINVVYHIDTNSPFTLNKNILSIRQNNGENERNANISISYRQGKIVKENTIKITQLPNTISDWLLTDIKPIKLVLQSNIDILPKEGGVIDLKVMKHSLKIFHKEDANGNILKDKHEEISIENVTPLCSFKVLNGDYIKLVGSHAIVPSQIEGNNTRTFEIMANLANLTTSKTFSQESGGIVHYDYDLAFLSTNKDNYTLELPTSIACDGYIPIKFTKNKYIDDKLVGKIGMQAKDLKFQYIDDEFNTSYKDTFETNWCKISIIKDEYDNDDKLQIYVEIIENSIKDIPRILSNITINGFDKLLYLTIIQPPLKLIKKEQLLELKGIDKYDYKSIPNGFVEFIPKIKYTYEDNSEEILNDIDDNYEIRYDIDNRGDIIINKFWKSDFNGTYGLLFDVKDKTTDTIIDIKGNIFSKINNEFICSSNNLNIEYKKNTITEIFDFPSENQEFIWKNNWIDKIFIPIISTTTIYDDGNITRKNIEYEIIGENNDNFNIDKTDNGIYIQPTKINETNDNIIEYLYIKQYNSNKSFNINLIQEPYKNDDIIVNIKVIVTKEEITEEIWSNESTLYVKDNNEQTLYTLFLSPCWLYPNMEKNEDIIYQGNIILKENKEYQFITTRFLLKKPISNIDYNINEKISFTKDENEMVIYIDL